jgi:holo-[acyl-carrier protein] synthase
MILGIGADLVEISRIEHMLEKYGTRFEERIFTERERKYCRQCARPAMNYAARFAAKEAFLKALGTGMSQGLNWREVEVVRNSAGCPSIQLSGKAQAFAETRRMNRIHLTLSHSKDQAISVVAIECMG